MRLNHSICRHVVFMYDLSQRRVSRIINSPDQPPLNRILVNTEQSPVVRYFQTQVRTTKSTKLFIEFYLSNSK